VLATFPDELLRFSFLPSKKFLLEHHLLLYTKMLVTLSSFVWNILKAKGESH